MRNIGGRITAGIMVASLLVLFFFHQTYDFNDKKPGPDIAVTIPDGATGTAIGELLESNRIIKNKKFFVDFYLKNENAKGIAPGVHVIQSHISTKLAVSQLLDQKRIKNSITVREGSTVSDVLSSLERSPDIRKERIDAKLLSLPLKNRNNSLEGQLFPAIYSFEPGTTTNQALEKMLERFSENINPKLKSKSGFTPYQILIIASMVQIEGDPSDYGKVARVIFNRLQINMPLQLNSTVQYAANLRGRIALSLTATKIDSPYNTYKHQGLPPTPISMPSEAAINATLNPIKGEWLYFITVKPGDTRFTKDYEEFQIWNSLYNSNLAKGLFK